MLFFCDSNFVIFLVFQILYIFVCIYICTHTFPWEVIHVKVPVFITLLIINFVTHKIASSVCFSLTFYLHLCVTLLFIHFSIAMFEVSHLEEALRFYSFTHYERFFHLIEKFNPFSVYHHAGYAQIYTFYLPVIGQ